MEDLGKKSDIIIFTQHLINLAADSKMHSMVII